MSAEGKPNTFYLHRNQDISGVSGTGDVAWGVEFPDGKCVLNWHASDDVPGCISIWNSVDEMLQVHGHEGATVVHYINL